MLMIRLQRTGKRGQAYFRVVILEHSSRVKGKFLELLGSYNPHEKQFKVAKERIEYWLSKGAQLSPTVNNLLVNYKIMDRPKVQSWKPKKRQAADDKVKAAGEKTEVKAATEVEQEEKPTEDTEKIAGSNTDTNSAVTPQFELKAEEASPASPV